MIFDIHKVMTCLIGSKMDNNCMKMINLRIFIWILNQLQFFFVLMFQFFSLFEKLFILEFVLDVLVFFYLELVFEFLDIFWTHFIFIKHHFILVLESFMNFKQFLRKSKQFLINFSNFSSNCCLFLNLFTKIMSIIQFKHLKIQSLVQVNLVLILSLLKVSLELKWHHRCKFWDEVMSELDRFIIRDFIWESYWNCTQDIIVLRHKLNEVFSLVFLKHHLIIF